MRRYVVMDVASDTGVVDSQFCPRRGGGWDNQIMHPGLFNIMIKGSDAVMNHDHDSVPAQATQQNPSHDGSKHALHSARKTIQHIRRQKGAMQELRDTP